MSFISYIAELITITPDEIGLKAPVTNANTIFTNALNAAYLWAGIICILIIIVAGYFYVISNGDAAKIKRAKDAIMGAIIGLVVIILAFTITQFVIGRF